MQQKIPFWKTIQSAYSLILLFGFVFFIGLTLITRANSNQQNQAIYNDRKTERQANFDVITRLDSQSLRDLANEDTYWDDMVAFIANPNSEAGNTFKEDILKSQLDVYNSNAVWTYNAQYKLVSNTNTFEPAQAKLDLGLSQKDLSQIFATSHEAHFYKQTPAGLLEVFGSTVHPSSDKDHKTLRQGYFFIARTMDKAYTDMIASDTANAVQVVGTEHANELQTNFAPSQGKIAFYKNLYSFDNTLAGQMYVQYNATAIGQVVKSFNRLIITIIAGYIILAVAAYLMLGRFMIRPLTHIYSALATGKTKPLEELVSNRSEFGRIASLIIDSFNQRDEIARAVDQTKTAQIALEKRKEELEHTNNLMVNRELRMIELKKEIAELKTQIKAKK